MLGLGMGGGKTTAVTKYLKEGKKTYIVKEIDDTKGETFNTTKDVRVVWITSRVLFAAIAS